MPSTIPLIAAQSMTAVSIGVQVNASAPPEVRFDIAMSVNGQTFYDTQYARVWYNAPAISVVIDDGKKILSNSIAKGIGNGNGIAEPGEEILIARQDSIEMKLFTEDPYVDITQEKLYGKNLGAPWNDGYTTFSRVKIADNAPVGHQIVFLGRYGRKPPPEYDRAINWGTATITIHQAPGYKSK